MKSTVFSFGILALVTVAASAVSVAQAVTGDLIPKPGKMVLRDGAYLLKAKEVTGECLKVGRDAAMPKEGYRLTVTENGISAASADDAGAFYALQTLLQLAVPAGKGVFSVPCVEITDSPQYGWRGVMLDDARHFLGKETVKKTLDLMGQYKLNVFHWHLVDDQGWRLEIKSHPELVEYGAARPESVGFAERPVFVKGEGVRYKLNGEKYGPFFYTQDDVREIIAYAAERHITVVPEIEIPGHVRALLAARPDLGCRGNELERVPRIGWGIEKDVLCAGNDDTIKFMEDIFDEVCALFPSEIIHIGGDECPKDRWEVCPKCQARKKSLGVADERGLQAWMTTHFAEYLGKKGKRAVGWDEVLFGDVPKNVIGMSWRMPKKTGKARKEFVSAAQAVERGFDIVMTPNGFCYYSYRQAIPEDPYPYYQVGDPLPLDKAYSFDPMADLPGSARAHVLGGQAGIWTESIWNRYDLEWKMWPRTFAMAEILWSAPPSPRDYLDFRRRATVHRRRLIAQNVNCAPVP